MHDCPKCKSPTLVPLSAPRRCAPGGDPFIPPCRCSRCRGVWLPHEAVEAHQMPGSMDLGSQVPADTDARSRHLSALRGVLVRARVDGDHPFHLDRCPICSGIWFDAGEWAAIAASEWLTHVDDLWDRCGASGSGSAAPKSVTSRRCSTPRRGGVREGGRGGADASRTSDALARLSFLIDELRGPGR